MNQRTLNNRLFRSARAVLMVLGAFSFLSSCAGKTPIPEPEIDSYKPAMRELGERLADRLGELDGGLGKPNTYFIYNADLKDGEVVESELANRLITRLKENLVKRGIAIKRKELATWARATGDLSRVECSEILETIAADYLIEVRIREAQDPSDGLKASVQVLPENSNDILFADAEPLGRSSRVKGWHVRTHYLQPVKGSAQYPFTDRYEVAAHIVGQVVCNARRQLDQEEAEPMYVELGLTLETPGNSPFLDAVENAISNSGVVSAVTGKWLSLLMLTEDAHELGIFHGKHREKITPPEFLIALDVEQYEDLEKVTAQLINFGALKMEKDGQIIRVPAKTIRPNCSAVVYFEDVYIVDVTTSDEIDDDACQKVIEANNDRIIENLVIPWLVSKTEYSMAEIRSIVNEDRANWAPPGAPDCAGAGPPHLRGKWRINKKIFNSWISKKLVRLRTDHLGDDPAWFKAHARANHYLFYRAWENAVKELKALIADLKARGVDRKTARAQLRAANHPFIDFSPRRDLGIAYYHLGKTREAIDELIASMEERETSDPLALKYLERTINQWVGKEPGALDAPRVRLDSTPYPTPTNAEYVNIEGVARADAFVKTLWIDGRGYPIDIPKQEVRFSRRVRVLPGENRLSVVVEDFAGAFSPEEIATIQVDRTGPMLRVHLSDGKPVSLMVFAFDESGVKEVSVNGRQIVYNNSKKKWQNPEPVLVDPSEEEWMIRAMDHVGNITIGSISRTGETSGSGANAFLLKSSSGVEPDVHIESDLDAETVTLYDSLLMGWRIRADDNIRELILTENGRKIRLGVHGDRGDVFFSHRAGLTKKFNDIVVAAPRGANPIRPHVTRIKKERLDKLNLADKAEIMFAPVTWGSGSPKRLPANYTGVFEQDLKESIHGASRFSIFVRESTSGRRAESISYILYCEIEEFMDSYIVYIQLVNEKTGEELALVSVEKEYGDETAPSSRNDLCNDIVKKLLLEMPMAQGRVLGKNGRRIHLDINADSGVKPGMEFLIFKFIKVVKDRKTGFIYGADMNIIARAKIESVNEDMTAALLTEDVEMDPDSGNYLAITR